MEVLEFLKNNRGIILLLDPDKLELEDIAGLEKRIKNSPVQLIFVGGSEVAPGKTDQIVTALKNQINIPIILFPGSHEQISDRADAILFLSLISGRNPEYLIDQHVKSVPKLRSVDLEIIPTSYLLIDGGNQPSTARVTQTNGMPQEHEQKIVDTAVAGQWQGKKLTYLEAGSGAIFPVKPAIISKVKKEINHPLIVGGGIKTAQNIEDALNAGAQFVVIGNAFENNPNLFEEISYAGLN
ncbi:MAG: geranylgeranylglyceryl/heptaprenylglyceryl phosphate synthase [Flavobacteriaceae bacterium]